MRDDVSARLSEDDGGRVRYMCVPNPKRICFGWSRAGGCRRGGIVLG